MPAVAAVNGTGEGQGQGEDEQRLRRERRVKMRQLQQDLDPRLDYEVRSFYLSIKSGWARLGELFGQLLRQMLMISCWCNRRCRRTCVVAWVVYPVNASSEQPFS